jgi:hypothetical protein
MVEYERFRRKKIEEGGRMNEDIDRMTAILSHPGDGGQPFSAPLFSENVERG